jgi:predicted O-methyltransferase YrrM
MIDALLLLILLLLLYLIYKIHLISKQLQEHPAHIQNAVERLEHASRNVFTQWEAYEFIRDRLHLREGLPFTRDWSASPDFLKIIAEHCLDAKPSCIVECSSGLTSLVLARCCQSNKQGQLYSLENGHEYAEKTRQELARYQLSDCASVIDAPLEKLVLREQTFQWYQTSKLPRKNIDMLVIDGPPGFIQRHSRYPALPLLYEQLADGCVVFLDDAARADEKAIVEQWLAAYPNMEHRYVKTARGCSILLVHK